ncbi:MAG: hypothetical protein CL676_09585 [Bdellovibrionaceae bacterium]|nr:hypothetical protein [Pseudobdellovibrionaceae bacterium]|tara:strand:- start:2999 stop:4219 length:1221 start_codon:yes stop_codon:yes gene_type:complete
MPINRAWVGFFSLAVFTVTLFQNCSAGNFEVVHSAGGMNAKESASLDIGGNRNGNQKSLNIDPLQGTLLISTFGAYSPDTFTTGKFAFGGWMSESDSNDYLQALENGANPSSIFGPDKIFITDVGATPDATLRNVKRALAVRGFHINDPVIIKPPSDLSVDRSSWLYMYFTMLDNNLAENCRQRNATLLECPELFTGHDVGLASSVDGGVTWEYRGKVIVANQSGDANGAWMPSARVVGDQIYLYYSTGRQTFDDENIYLQILAPDGVTPVGDAQNVNINTFKTGDLYANIDVHEIKEDNRNAFLMTANSGNQKKLHLFFSEDGIEFKELPESPIVASDIADQYVITPSIRSWGIEQLNGHETLKDTDQIFLFLDYATRGGSGPFEIRSLRLQIQNPFFQASDLIN